MPALIQQKFFVIQENASTSSAIKEGPFFDLGTAKARCQSIAAANIGIPFVVVKTTAGFATDSPASVPLEFFQPAPGEPPLDL